MRLKWILIGLAVLFVFLQIRLWVGEGSLAEVSTLKQEIRLQQSEIEKLQQRNAALQAEVDSLKNNLEAVEELARSDLGMIKRGEVFYQMPEPQNGKPSR